jgi:hypothetical protein
VNPEFFSLQVNVMRAVRELRWNYKSAIFMLAWLRNAVANEENQ